MNNILCHIDDFGLLKISGKKAGEFLQGQFTCDVNDVTEQHSCFGAYCNRKGRILTAFRLFIYQKDYYLCLPKAMLANTQTLLNKYAELVRVSIVDVSCEWQILGCAGEYMISQLAEYLQLHVPVDIPNTQYTTKIQPPTQRQKAAVSFDRLMIRVPNAAGIPRVETFIQASSNELTCLIQNLLNTSICQLKDHHYWHWLNIMAGIAYIYPETTERFTPHKLDYPALKAVSFTKGCYLGQEIVARTEHLSKNRQALYQINFHYTSAKRLDPIVNTQGKTIGHIIEIAVNQQSKTIADKISALVTLPLSDSVENDRLYIKEPKPKHIVSTIMRIAYDT